MIRSVFAYLKQADAYPDDWYRWLGGQAGHAAIIGGPLALLLIVCGVMPAPSGIIAGLVYWLVWEILIQRGRDWRDSLDDTVHVTMGATLVGMLFAFIPHPDRPAAAAWLGTAYLVWLLALVIGIFKRVKGAGTEPDETGV